MAHKVKITAAGKVLLTDVSSRAIGRVLVHVPASSTISMTFVGRPLEATGAPNALAAADDVTLGYYTPTSDSLASAAWGTSPGQVSVKSDGNAVYANVASVTGTVVVTVVPLEEA